MKKIYLFSFVLSILFTGLKAQTLPFELISTEGTPALVNNNDVFSTYVAPLATAEHNFKVKNKTAATLTVSIRKYEDTLNTVSVSPLDKAEAFFCTGSTCYQSSVMTASLVIPANDSATFRADLIEASQLGKSVIRYKFNNFAVPAEAIFIYMKYNNATGIKDYEGVFSSVSEVYPNPSSATSFININSLKEINGASLTLVNSVGAVVLSRSIDLNSGNNTVAIETESLSSGIYFVSIAHNSLLITKKITVE